MKFWKKILVVYMIFSIVISSTCGIVYYYLNVKQYKEKEYGELQTIASVKLEQMENILNSMNSVISYFLSDMEVLNSLDSLSATENLSYEERYIDEDVSLIRTKITTDYLLNNFYRIVVFNKSGVVISNTNYDNKQVSLNASYHNYPWKSEISGKKGKNTILGMHEDVWGAKMQPEVISVVKEIQGKNRGYIEVEQDRESLKEFLGDEDNHFHYIFYESNNKLLYTDFDKTKYESYYKTVYKEKKNTYSVKTAEGTSLLCIKKKSEDKGIGLIVISENNIDREAMNDALPISMVILISLLLFSYIYIWISSRYLTKPILQLQHFMETTELNNLDADMPLKSTNDEIENLYLSYKNVLERLQSAIIEEKRLSLMQLQAQFDLLQAQVNPHFIYNVLNVISARGMMSDDEIICEMCGELAAMLRYSTNTREKYASIQEEIRYLEHYLQLLKRRYNHKLTYKIEIPEDIKSERVPKIVLQQLVENAIIHGYENSEDIIKINIWGMRNHDRWFLQIIDYGKGVSDEAKEEIKTSIKNIKDKLSGNREQVEMEIGGMGIGNTFARLYMLYNESLIFSIEDVNKDEKSENKGGTIVTIGVCEE